MILKIRDGCTWVFRDGIVRVRVYDPVSYVGDPEKGGLEFTGGKEPPRPADYFTGMYEIFNDGQTHKACEVFLKLKSGTEWALLVGGQFYLLNDDGQTIESF